MTVTQARTRRAYRSPQREEAARATRQRILRAAASSFGERGYARTTIRSVAEQAGVSVPTVEALFGTKARLLKAAIDSAIAGDDEPVPMLERHWAAAAARAADPANLLAVVASALASAQARSFGLVLSVFDGADTDADLASLAAQMTAQRAAMATWFVAQLTALGALQRDLSSDDAVDTVFALMEPAVFERMTRQCGWTVSRYQDWVARSLARLLVDSSGPATGRRAIEAKERENER